MLDTLDRSAFAGVRVVELAQYVFVPAGGALLADFGAEVIKIEEPGRGDPYRSLQINDGRRTGSANLSMEQNNRGKKSLGLDLKSAEGREVFLKLIETADVFVTSLRPSAIERLGLGVEALRRRNPKLIYVRGNGVGFYGPEPNRPGYDASCFWARGGFSDVLRPPGVEQPVGPRPALGDHAGAANVALAIATALFRRERSGAPSVVDVSLLSTALWILSADVVLAQVPGFDDRAGRGQTTQHPLMRAYRCQDDRWLLLMLLEPARYWPGLCERIGQPELVHDPRYETNELRSQNGAELHEALSGIFAERPAKAWGEAFEGWDAPWEYVQSIREVAKDPEARANGYFFDVEVSDGTKVELIAGPLSIDGDPSPVTPRRAPLMGEHTREILTGLGLDGATIGRLTSQGTIG